MIGQSIARMVMNFEARYGVKPRGVCIGPSEYVQLLNEVRIPGDSMQMTEFQGLPLRYTASPGIELELGFEEMLRIYREYLT